MMIDEVERQPRNKRNYFTAAPPVSSCSFPTARLLRAPRSCGACRRLQAPRRGCGCAATGARRALKAAQAALQATQAQELKARAAQAAQGQAQEQAQVARGEQVHGPPQRQRLPLEEAGISQHSLRPGRLSSDAFFRAPPPPPQLPSPPVRLPLLPALPPHPQPRRLQLEPGYLSMRCVQVGLHLPK